MRESLEHPATITLAFTGASGMPYGIRLLEVLLQQGKQVYLLYSKVAQIVAQQEMALALPSSAKEAEAFLRDRYGITNGQLRVFGREEWFAPVASGSNPADAMVICPCTMGTLAAIAAGMSQNLIERAADVILKENRPLIIVPRENSNPFPEREPLTRSLPLCLRSWIVSKLFALIGVEQIITPIKKVTQPSAGIMSLLEKIHKYEASEATC